MSGRIIGFLREYILGLSILTIIPGVVFIFMGVVYCIFYQNRRTYEFSLTFHL